MHNLDDMARMLLIGESRLWTVWPGETLRSENAEWEAVPVARDG